MNLILNLRKRLLLFICITILCYVLTSLIAGIISYKWGTDSTKAMRIASVIQDLFLFVIPSLVTALLVTRIPASFLAVDKKPGMAALFISTCTLVAAIPLMNYIVNLNEALTFPESLRWIEEKLRDSEEHARNAVAVLQGGNTIGDLIMSILIVGILAGFSEEIFFRGTFQRLLTTGRIGHHTAIWTVAVVFSLLHFQFYGFIPRTLLGAYFGYLLWWTRSLWIPITIHALNNTIYVVTQWHAKSFGGYGTLDHIGEDGDAMTVIASLLLSAAGIFMLRRQGRLIRNSCGER